MSYLIVVHTHVSTYLSNALFAMRVLLNVLKETKRMFPLNNFFLQKLMIKEHKATRQFIITINLTIVDHYD